MARPGKHAISVFHKNPIADGDIPLEDHVFSRASHWSLQHAWRSSSSPLLVEYTFPSFNRHNEIHLFELFLEQRFGSSIFNIGAMKMICAKNNSSWKMMSMSGVSRRGSLRCSNDYITPPPLWPFPSCRSNTTERSSEEASSHRCSNRTTYHWIRYRIAHAIHASGN